jgi:Domain of unknown function (DUF4395)
MNVDPRGLRFVAWLSTIVLAATLVTHSAWLAGAQAVIFGVGAILGLRYAPYGLVFRALVAPRIGPPGELEPAAPPRFAQAVGLFFATVGAIGYAFGVTALGVTAIGLALAAAFLNAAFGLCLGCELYLLIRRMTTAHPEGATA